ncbi:lipase maturation factor 2a [Notothenia coriiceps]|uniref:Lipase maturation factor n=1 Tax=Notothenia coriiceps TaxID=8208 RepID=A0A6I9NI42_9TELE|nr:PREDICTED: lipase maturation factor 2 [Notothenia coriiceps]
MGEIIQPRRMFLWSMAVIYLAAFVSLYVQIPGLYGNEGLLPARWQLKYSGKSLWEQLLSSPSLLWFGPQLGVDTHTAMELLCLLGAALSFAATLVESLRDSVVFFCLWALYLSMYQVGQVFLYFQWDNLLLETGFLCILVAPLTLLRGSRGVREHDRLTFWLTRWLLFRLMFASGVVKLMSRCPTWWGLTALTYHYETQCLPTSLAWFAHQLPLWWQKLSVVGTFVIEIVVPLLFFSPQRRLRIGAFYLQVLLQVLIILSGNYNFFNLLTLALCLSLLDDQHVNFWLRKADKISNNDSRLCSWLCYLLELAVWSLMIFGSVVCFDLKLDSTKKGITSKTGKYLWEIEFMYKPGNLSAPPAVVTPHQPRLDWQMWFAALGDQTQAPWFTSLMYRLLQGKRDVIELIQTDVSQYPFHQEPPAYLRAHRYRYWFTEPKADGSYPERWWRRVYDEEFYPTVHLGNTFLETMLTQYGLKDKSPPRRLPNTPVAKAVRWVRSHVRGVPAPVLIWTLIACSATLCLLHGLQSRNKHTERTAGTQKEAMTDQKANAPDSAPDTGGKSDEEQEAEEEEEEEDGGDCEDEVEDCEGEEKYPVGDDKEEEDGMEAEEILEKRKF